MIGKTQWFKAKTYGLGWTPISWQGWFVSLAYVAIISLDAHFFVRSSLAETSHIAPTPQDFLFFILRLLGVTCLLIAIAYKTGGRSNWRLRQH